MLRLFLSLPLCIFFFSIGFGQGKCALDTQHSSMVSASEIEGYFQQKSLSRLAEDINYVPLTIHVVRNYENEPFPNFDYLQSALKSTNASFLELGIQFYLCSDIEYIVSQALYHYESEGTLLVPYNDPNTIDIFIVESIDAYSVCGLATLGSTVDGYILLSNGCLDAATMSHELGHYFNLYHTHETALGKELVNGSNCATAGDLLCDTPADPNLYKRTGDCVFKGTDKDPNGQAYTPLTNNFMSYSASYCQNSFTPQQQLRMRYHFEKFVQPATQCTPKPDLSVALNDYPSRLYKLENNLLKLRIGNMSNIAYNGPITIQVSLKDKYDEKFTVATKTISRNLAGYSEDTASVFAFVPSGVDDGQCQLLVEIDANNQINETAENNNSVQVLVSSFPRSSKLPDLHLKALVWDSLLPMGSQYTVSYSVSNDGPETSSNYMVSLFFSKDNKISNDDLRMRQSGPVLKSLESKNVSARIGFPQQIGATFYVLIAVDLDNSIVELDETNNFLERKVIVTDPNTAAPLPDLKVVRPTKYNDTVQILRMTSIDFGKQKQARDLPMALMYAPTFPKTA